MLNTIIALLFLLLFLTPAAQAGDKPAEFILGQVTIANVSQQADLFRESSSFGAAVYDGNGDGWPDLIVSNHGNPPAIFFNRAGKTFEDVTRRLLPLGNSDRHSPLLADYDNDGDQDLLILHGAHDGTGLGPNEFYSNPGPGKPFVPLFDAALEDPKGRGRVGIWFDYDNDGLLDLYLVNKNREDAPNRLLRNEGNGRFRDVSEGSGLDVVLKSEGGAVAGDIDNDNDMDLLINDSWTRPRLFINQGNGIFTEEGIRRGLPAHAYNWSFGMADYNNDGFLDIYISGGLDATTGEGALLSPQRLNFLQRVDGIVDRVDSLSFESGPQAVLNFAFDRHLVEKDRIFIGAAGYRPGTVQFSIGPGFISADGRPVQWKDDGSVRGVFIWRDPITNRVFVRSAAGDSSFRAGALVESDSPMSSLDTSGMEDRRRKFSNFLLKNNGDGTFADVTGQTGTQDVSNSRSPLWLDLDNDADLDLFIVNAGYNGPGKQEDTCLLNDGNGTFSRYSLPQGPIERFGRGDCGLIADFNRDGLLDLFVVNGSGLLPANKGPYQLFLNRTPASNRWIEFRLAGAGKDFTNADAVGARASLRASGSNTTQWQFVLGGSGSYCQSTRILHFGLGSADTAVVRIDWPPSRRFPRGHRQTFTFNASQMNRIYTIRERGGLE